MSNNALKFENSRQTHFLKPMTIAEVDNNYVGLLIVNVFVAGYFFIEPPKCEINPCGSLWIVLGCGQAACVWGYYWLHRMGIIAKKFEKQGVNIRGVILKKSLVDRGEGCYGFRVVYRFNFDGEAWLG